MAIKWDEKYEIEVLRRQIKEYQQNIKERNKKWIGHCQSNNNSIEKDGSKEWMVKGKLFNTYYWYHSMISWYNIVLLVVLYYNSIS